MEEAFPNFSTKYGQIASNTSGRRGLVALLSRYTLCMVTSRSSLVACRCSHCAWANASTKGGQHLPILAIYWIQAGDVRFGPVAVRIHEERPAKGKSHRASIGTYWVG